MELDTILPGHQNDNYQWSNREEFQNGSNINTDFEVTTKPPPTEPTTPPKFNFDFHLLTTDASNVDIRQQIRISNRDPDQYLKYLLDTVLERKVKTT